MNQETYEKIIEVLTEKLSFTEWKLEQSEKNITTLQQEKVRIRRAEEK